jgi:hypothetical protein
MSFGATGKSLLANLKYRRNMRPMRHEMDSHVARDFEGRNADLLKAAEARLN